RAVRHGHGAPGRRAPPESVPGDVRAARAGSNCEALQGIGCVLSPWATLRAIPTRRIGALRDSEPYRAILGLTAPWTLANGEPDGRKKTTIALSRRSGSIRVLLELDGLALRQREQFDLVRACGCAAIPVPYPARRVANGCRTSI